MKVCRRAVRRERLVRWVICIVSVVVVLVWGGVVSSSVLMLLLLGGRLEGVSSWATRVVLVECESLVSPMFFVVSFWPR